MNGRFLANVLAAIGLLLVLVVLVIVMVLTAEGESSAAQPRSDAAILEHVILVARAEPDETGIYADEVAALPRARSQEDLERLVDARTRVIIVDQSMAHRLDAKFLALQLARGIQLFGLNIPHDELREIAGWPVAYVLAQGESPPSGIEVWEATPPEGAFFSYQTLTSNSHGQGIGTLESAEGLFQLRIGDAAGYACDEDAGWETCRLAPAPNQPPGAR